MPIVQMQIPVRLPGSSPARIPCRPVCVTPPAPPPEPLPPPVCPQAPLPSVPVKLPGSYPPRVPQPAAYNPSPLPKPRDYYVTRAEVKELLESLDMSNVMHKVPGATEGSVPVFGPDGELVDSKTLMESLRETLSSDAAAIATIMEILTSRDEASRASALGIREMLDSMPDPEDMTQGEKTDFILKLVEYALVKEDLARTT